MRSRLFALGMALLATAALAAPDRAALDTALATFRSGDVRTARAQIAQVVAANPGWTEAMVAQAEIALAAGDGVLAETRLRQAWKGGVKQATLRHLFAHAFLIQGRAEDAAREAGFDDIPALNAAYAARIRAVALWQLGNRNGAVAAIQRAAQLDPRDARIFADMGGIYRDYGDVAAAFDATERALALDPRNVAALMLSAALVRDRYGYAASLPWYDRVLDIDRTNAAALLDRAAALGELGRAREMLAATRAALAVSPNNARAFYLQAVLAARAGDWGLARSLLYRIRGRLGDLPGQRLLAGAVEVAQGNGEQAIIELRPLVAQQPANLAARRLLAAAFANAGDWHAVIETLRPFVGRPDADSYSLTLMGRAYEQLGDRMAAGAWLDRAAQPLKGPSVAFSGRGSGGDTQSGDPGVIVYAGDTLAMRGDWRGAAAAYQRAVNLSFSDANALKLVDALRRAGDTKAALVVVATYRMQHPRSPAALLLGADAALAAEDWANGAVMLGDVRQLGGDRDATMLNNLGWVAANRGRPEMAAAFGSAAYRLQPNSAPVAASYGWFAHLAGDRSTAVALLEKAVVLGPDIPQYRERLAKANAAR